MTSRPRRKPSWQPNSSQENCDPLMTDDSKTIALRVSVIGGDRLADDYQVT
jgi:hypothetical protein